MKNKIGLLVTVSAVLSSLLFSGVAFAQTNNNNEHQKLEWNGPMDHISLGVFGTVTAINGNILTVTAGNKVKDFDSDDATTTANVQSYSVTATNAKVTKNGSAVALSAVNIGDTIFAQGSVNGTTVTATAIQDGIMGHGIVKKLPVPKIQGNGEPVIGGTVTAINGSTLTVTNKSNVTYTIAATSAVVLKSNATSTLSNVSVGDAVLVQGVVNGNTVTASSIIDSAPKANTNNNSQGDAHKSIEGFFGGLGIFFRGIFGFF